MHKENKIMKEVAEELFEEMINKLMTDKESIVKEIPEGSFERVARKLGISADNAEPQKIKKRPKVRLYWAAAVIAAVLVFSIGGASVGAWNLSYIIETFNKITNNNFILSVDKKVLNQNELQSLYSTLYNSKNDFEFTPMVFSTFPQGLKYKGFEKTLGGRELIIFYEKDDIRVQFIQGYASGNDTLSTNADNSNTEEKKIKINKRDAIIYIVKNDTPNNYRVKWTEENNCYYIVTSRGLTLDELVNMVKNLKAL